MDMVWVWKPHPKFLRKNPGGNSNPKFPREFQRFLNRVSSFFSCAEAKKPSLPRWRLHQNELLGIDAELHQVSSVGRLSFRSSIKAVGNFFETSFFSGSHFLFRCGNIHFRNLTWNLKIGNPKRKLIFQPSFFRGYVKFRGCMFIYQCMVYLSYVCHKKTTYIMYPICLMYGISLTTFYHEFKPTVGKYSSPMDGMGMVAPPTL